MMMRTIYEIAQNDFMVASLSDATCTIDAAKDLIMRLCSSYSLALELLEENDIESRLDAEIICDKGMEVMCGLHDLKTFLNGELDDLREQINITVDVEEVRRPYEQESDPDGEEQDSSRHH